jgi:hypothetical protein
MEIKKACMSYLMQAQRKPGSVLLSHQVALAVPSAPRSLTSEFGMGSGVASLISPPEIVGPASSGQALAASFERRLLSAVSCATRHPSSGREAQ